MVVDNSEEERRDADLRSKVGNPMDDDVNVLERTPLLMGNAAPN